jgi:Tfp pilus assembly protein PilN
LLILGALCVGAWSSVVLWQNQLMRRLRLQVLELQVARLESAAVRSEELAKQRALLSARVQEIAGLDRDARRVVERLGALPAAAPEGVWFLELTEEGAGVMLEGRARAMDDVSRLADALRTSGAFGETVDIQSTAAELTERSSLIRFRIRTAQ